MTNVFIGGSRKLTKLTAPIEGRIFNIIKNDFTILIGDANGADKCVQHFLASKCYANVIVFCMGDTCRNNIGNWEIKRIVATSNEKNFDFYAIKDLQMAEESSYGFMIWDGRSNGTLNNILNLLRRRKKVLVYFSPEMSFFTLNGVDNLIALLARCEKGALEKFEKKLGLTKFLKKEQSNLEFA